MLLAGIKVHKRPTLYWALGYLMASLSQFVGAVEFDPSVSVGVTRVDNVALSAENPQYESAWQVMPGFTLAQASQRLTADAIYLLHAIHYEDRNENDVFHSFDSRLSAALHPDRFFVEMGANRSQSIRDPQVSIPFGNLAITDNRVDREDYYIGPLLRYPVGDVATVSTSYRRLWVDYTDEPNDAFDFESEDLTHDSALLSVDNYSRGRGLTWALGYSSDRTDYDSSGTWEYRHAELELGFWVAEAARIFASGGKESAWDKPSDPSLQDRFWEAGFAHEGGTRLSVEAAVGERSFGSVRRGRLSYNFSRGTTSLIFSTSPWTQGRERFERGGLLEPRLPNDFLSRPGSAERYVLDRFQWDLTFELRRTEFLFVFSDEKREQRTSISGIPLTDESQASFSLTITRQVGRRTQVFMNAGQSELTFDAFQTDFTRGSVGAHLEASPRVRLSLQYEYWNDSDEEFQDAGYTANLFSVFLRWAL